MEKVRILEFSVKRLHKFYDITVRFDNNVVILVGENGSGKTTICKMLYYILTRDWRQLDRYQFDLVRLSFIDKTSHKHSITLRKDDVGSFSNFSQVTNRHRYMLRRYESDFSELVAEDTDIDEMDDETKQALALYKQASSRVEHELLRYKEIDNLIRRSFENGVLYLPTYRRIEDDESELFQFEDKRYQSNRPLKHSSEMIHFGMRDVEKAIKNRQVELSLYSSREQNALMSRFLHQALRVNSLPSLNKLRATTDDELSEALSRISSANFTEQERDLLFDAFHDATNMHSHIFDESQNSIIITFLLELLRFNKNIKAKERAMIDFMQKCNHYLENKLVAYTPSDFSCKLNGGSVYDANARETSWGDLSSGEKQIVSLFSKLILEMHSGLFVIIDEPELSLSIEWQSKFLCDIVDCDSCNGLLAVTHSPFIFNNNLVCYVHGINEFTEVHNHE